MPSWRVPSKYSFWWRRLSSSSSSSRRLDQDEYICLSRVSSGDVFKTSSGRLDQDQYIRLGDTSSRRLVKTPSRHLQYVLPRRLAKTSSKRLAKTYSRHLQGIFKTSWRRFQNLQRCLQDAFKRYHQVKLFLLSCVRDVFNTFLRRTAKAVTYRKICLGHTSKKFMVSVQNLQEW